MFVEAEDLYLKELELANERPEGRIQHIVGVLHNLAQSYLQRGEVEQSLQTYEKVLALMEVDPQTPPLNLAYCKYD
jgi:tetratricopeptide (TPR) repeat protein